MPIQYQYFCIDYPIQLDNNNTCLQNNEFCGCYKGRYDRSKHGRGHGGRSSIQCQVWSYNSHLLQSL